jgi:hypothetical protein
VFSLVAVALHELGHIFGRHQNSPSAMVREQWTACNQFVRRFSTRLAEANVSGEGDARHDPVLFLPSVFSSFFVIRQTPVQVTMILRDAGWPVLQSAKQGAPA